MKKNEYIDYPVGTVFKEDYQEDGKHYFYYYILGRYYVYSNDYYNPAIRPWKFNTDEYTIATDEEKRKFVEALKDNHLIWNEKTGELEQEYEELELSVKVKVRPGVGVDKVIDILNERNGKPFGVFEMKFRK